MRDMRKGILDMKKHNQRFVAVILAIILAAALVLSLLLTAVYASDGSVSGASEAQATADDTDSSGYTCMDGVYIENVNVSGMTKDEVQDVINKKIENLSSDVITLYAGSQTAQVTAGDLGLYCTDTSLADEAVNIGRRGNIVKRFRADQYVKENGRIVLSLDLAVKESKVRDAINACLDTLNTDPQPPTIEIASDGTLTKVDKVDGTEVDVSQSVSAVTDYMDNDWHGGAGGVRLSCTTIAATGDLADLDGITDLLGTYTTQFDSSNTGRVQNIRRAAELINGTIIQPGEEFDFSEIVGETTAENGFALAGSYENGTVVDTYGGGICQDSTTLYNAVIRAELEVTERYPHSITVNYVDPSLDAAIADGSKDFCFKNSTDYPIYIYANVGESEVTFAVLGKETRDSGRTLQFESRTVSTTAYTTTVKLDSSRNYGVIESSGGHDGLVAQAWKIVYVNGVKQSEEQVNESEYEMSPLTYLVGVKGASESQLAALQTAAANNDISTIRSLVW